MILLIIGSSGLLGRELCKQLLEQGHTVYGVDIQRQVIFDEKYHHSDHINGDIRYDYVYCLAGFPCPKTYLSIPATTMLISSNTLTQALLCAARQKAVFVYTSSSEVYDDNTTSDMVEEEIGTIDLEHPRACYKELKRHAEVLVHAFRREYQLETRIVRVFNSYGEGHQNDTRIINQLITSVRKNVPFIIYGDGEQKRSYCYVEDTVKGILTAAHSKVKFPVNIGNPYEIYSVNEVIEIVEDITKHKIDVIYDKQESMVGPIFRRPNIDRALQLGWKPITTLYDGITKLLRV